MATGINSYCLDSIMTLRVCSLIPRPFVQRMYHLLHTHVPTSLLNILAYNGYHLCMTESDPCLGWLGSGTKTKEC